MLLLHEVHTVAGRHEDAFEAAFREGWMPTLAKGDDARLLYYLKLAHGTGRVGGAHPDPGRPDHLLREVGHREAALLLLLLAALLDDDRVDEDDHAVRIGTDREVDDGDPAVDADLRRGEPDPGRGMAGRHHVGDESGDVIGARVDLGILGRQTRIAPADEVPDQAGDAPRRRRATKGLSSALQGLSPPHDTGAPTSSETSLISA